MTRLSTRGYAPLLKIVAVIGRYNKSSAYSVSVIHEAHANDYFFTLVYFLLNSSDLAVERVRDRVVSGGHHIPEDVIRRRFAAELKILHELYVPICDYWMIIDNSEHPSVVITEGFKVEEKNMYPLKSGWSLSGIVECLEPVHIKITLSLTV
jgi:hypothetical protein